jgi:AcrR family transcriptional regulator
MRTRRSRVEQKETTRRRLLDAARRVFLRRGFHATSLDLVAIEAGFTKGAVYSRFRSKADLFLALLEERIAQRIDEMRSAAAGARGTLTVATALGRQWDQKLSQDEHWSLLLIEFRLHAARIPALNRRYAALHGRLRAAMAELITADAADAGDTLVLPAEDIARAALALGTGAVLERAADGAAFPAHLMEAVQRAMREGLASTTGVPAARRARQAAS